MSKKTNETAGIPAESIFDFDVDSIFGEFTPSETPIPEPKKEEEENEEEVEETTKKTNTDPLENEDDGDGDGDEGEEEEEVEKEEEETADTTDSIEEDEEEDIEYSYKGIASYLAEKGLIDFEDSDEIEDTEEVLESAVENTINNLINEYKNSIPEVGRQFLDYVQNGGNPESFFQTLEKPLDFNNLDLEDENTQKRVIRELLKEQNYTDEEISEHIEDYEDGLILDKRAKTAARKLEEIYNKKQEKLLQKQELENQARAEKYNQYVESIKETIDSSDALAGLQLNRTDKKAFQEYLLATDKDGKTKYQREVEKDPVKTQLELAYLKFKNYDFSKAKKQGQSEASKKIKKLIKNTDKVNSTRSKQNKRSGSSSVDLSDFGRFL